MGDTYQEIMVKRNTPASDKIKKFALIAVTVLCLLAGLLINQLLFFAGVALVIVCYFVLPRFDLEYEYLYVNGELDIDKIMNKQKRKRCASYSMDNLELLAPSNSHEFDHYLTNREVKISDYTSLDPNTPSYTLIMNQEKGKELVRVELTETVVKDIRRIAPRKVLQY